MQHNTFSCFVIGTTLANRQNSMINTLKSIDNQNFPFKIKILSIDDFGEGLSKEVQHYTENNGWRLILDKRGGMVQNQIRALKYIDSDWVFYCEDDVVVEKIPTLQKIETFLTNKPKTGIISFTGGGYDVYKPENYDKIISNLKNEIIEIDENEIMWFRDSLLANEWFFEFPTMLVRTNIIKNCIDNSLKEFKNLQIEQSYTKSYFKLKFNEQYEKYSWSRDFRPYIKKNENINIFLNLICNEFVYIKHERNQEAPSVGGGYFV